MDWRFSIDGENWIIKLDDSNELSFAFLVPYERTIYATDPLWHDWGWGVETDEYENYYESVGVSSINIFKLKTVLLDEIRKFIKHKKINFFYFQPNTDKKAIVYQRISKDLLKLLGGEWDLQDYKYWFYFYKK